MYYGLHETKIFTFLHIIVVFQPNGVELETMALLMSTFGALCCHVFCQTFWYVLHDSKCFQRDQKMLCHIFSFSYVCWIFRGTRTFNFLHNYIKASVLYGPINLLYKNCQCHHHCQLNGVIDFSMAILICSMELESNHQGQWPIWWLL